MDKIKQITLYGVLAIVFVIGVIAFYTQTVEGHHVTGTSKDVPWGIYISAFAYFVGASAGATLIGFLIHAFGRKEYQKLGVRAILIGILSLAAAIMLVMADVGQPLRMFLVPWVLSNASSMFFISSTSYYLFMVLLLAELYFLVKVLRGKASEREIKISKWLAIIAVPYALLVVHMVTGFIFGVVKTREYWNTPLLPMHFIMSALATGTAFIILASAFSSQLYSRRKPLLSAKALNHFGLLFAGFLGVTLLFDLADVVVLKYSEHPEGVEAWHILTGSHTVLFTINWLFLIIALVIVSFKKFRTMGMMTVSAVLTLVAIAAYRYNLVIVPQKVPLLPGLDEISYSPSSVEISVVAGVVAFVALVYFMALKWKPIKEALDVEMAEVDALEANGDNYVSEEKIMAESHA